MKDENKNIKKVKAISRTKLYLGDILEEGNILHPCSKPIEGFVSLDRNPHYELVITKDSRLIETLRRRGVPPSGLIECIGYQLNKDSEGVYLEEKSLSSFPEGTQGYNKFDKILKKVGILE